MSHVVEKVLPSAEEVLSQLPLDDSLAEQVKQDRKEIRDILSGKDSRKLLIIGPCSAWPDQAVVEYAERLKPVSDKYSNKLKLVLRAYLQKPRTTVGWLGPMNQVDPFKAPDVEEGISYSRKMMLDILKIGLPLADEAVFTHNDGYIVDLLSWVAIGARATEDQEHRIFASMIPHPVGMKNPTSGNLQVAMNSLIAAQHPHVCVMHREQVRTSGNPYAHLILRGGNGSTNYQFEDLEKTADLLDRTSLENKSVIVDASHDNSIDADGKKDFRRQPEVVFDVLESAKKDQRIASYVKGFMVESFLESGAQKAAEFNSVADLKFGQSITDGCLGWQDTSEFLDELYKQL